MSIQRQLTNERMSQVVVHNGTVYLSGQVGNDMTADVEQQTREVLNSIERLLDLAGTDKTRILSVTIYLKDINAHFAGMNSVWDKWLPKGFAPARATVEAKLCEPEMLVERCLDPCCPARPCVGFVLSLSILSGK
ncbi:Endoribonuclease L-PSP [Pseudomonas syringae pv. papulans]|uniref:RidA family protein n=1 Tax=Pseudomonas syringae TaxID=317 RepID=UPI0006E4AC8A|nr:RidA family protein [Pseudomonas syringae]KPY31550.1 Endoribonuclease L-PSP [Pseudomonas syringae pv. papulans]RMN39271.1 Endoribonuclease L-PSP [Pseudomonas syringae pv. papulans]RMN70180.1 Endoribonuclease L-PSP [Pseudomonas syringae pv. papulans]RMV45931.1 Endoribonuclease L-PSP [Pseudomonas syringae pv. papulans]